MRMKGLDVSGTIDGNWESGVSGRFGEKGETHCSCSVRGIE